MENTIPKHVAIIPDGNRRWAKKNGFPTIEGHRRGANNFVELSRKAKKMGVKVFTLWGFSTENWKRTREEVGYLMKLFEQIIDQQLTDAVQEKTRIVHLGRKDRLSPSLKEKIENAERQTKIFDQYYSVVALDYGGKDEMMRAINKTVQEKKEEYTSSDIEKNLDTNVLPYPYPDLIIRTSGEQRLSGFMAWQSEYSELYFSSLLFPDFSPGEFEKAITEFSSRQRRFGE